MPSMQLAPEVVLRHASVLPGVNPADAGIGRPTGHGPPVRLVPGAVALLVALILLGGLLTSAITWSASLVAWLVLATTFTAVGAAVTWRVPENPFGWVLLAIGTTSAIAVGAAGDEVTGA